MFENSDLPDAMVNNFTRLQPVLTRLGIHFDGRMVRPQDVRRWPAALPN